MKVNYKLGILTTIFISTFILAYRGPNPPVGNGIHRYQFLVYRQPVSNMVDMVDVPAIDDPVAEWDVGEFLRVNGIDPEDYLAAFQFRSGRFPESGAL